MKNKVSDLRNHMFAALDRLNDVEKLTKEEVQMEIDKSNAIGSIGKVIIETAKTELAYARFLNGEVPKNFLELPEEDNKNPILTRPAAQYSNKPHSHAEN